MPTHPQCDPQLLSLPLKLTIQQTQTNQNRQRKRERESNANARKRRRNTSCRRAGCIELVALRHLAPDALVLLFVLPITFCMLPCAPTSPHTTTTTATLATTNKCSHCFSLLLLLFLLGFWSARCRLCRRRRQRQRDVDVFFCSSCHCCCCCFCCSYASCYTYPMRCYMLYMLNPSKLTTRNPQFEMCEPLYERVCRVFSCQRALKTIRQLIRSPYK